MRTGEMTSYSYSADFILDVENQIRKITYSYTSKPKPSVTERSAPHDGTILFEIMGRPVSRLKGQYWTARKTIGEIELTFRTKDMLDDMLC